MRPALTHWHNLIVLMPTRGPNAVAAMAEEKKEVNFNCLTVPVDMETPDAIGLKSLIFLKDIGRKIKQHTGEEKTLHYMLQQLAVAVQRGNALAVLGAVGSSSSQDKPFFGLINFIPIGLYVFLSIF